ncbi:putative ubiquinone biosynthesis monooxygenase, partial [Tulasnella sp. 403]
IQLLDNVKVDAITPDEPDNGRWPVVRLSNGRALRARLLIGADGFNSPVKKYAGIRTYGWAYDTHAVVATMFHHPLYPGTPLTAYQRFLPTGPIAFLPLSNTVSSLVWSTKPAIAAALKASHPDVLRWMINAAFRLPDVSLRVLNDMVLSSKDLPPQELADTIKWREEAHGIAPMSSLSSFGEGSAAVGGYGDEVELPPLVTSIQPGSVAGFPLRMSHAEMYLGEGAGTRTALVGDAAHTVHPLAGQGLNMGLADVESLATCIGDALKVGADIGSRTALAPYPKERYFENHKMISATDKLHKLYGTTWPPFVWARSVGLEVVNELDTIKAGLMASAGSQSRRASVNPLWAAMTMGIEGLVGLGHTAESFVRGAADLSAALLKGSAGK